ncbi:DUF4214 domain-containing protein [Aquabacter sediminis]|uniref:DUF4214 domain-containing protein n=1 Tax=Aquabacter sediminis TaxID=3029197 RepID=UPI00237E6BF0|nr:DUF4214 domain-containing protein [Aquabacter sp. P-9]MDE1566928.1 DUF4214 domain-containing protein [Aquabacter sp. P-9]
MTSGSSGIDNGNQPTYGWDVIDSSLVSGDPRTTLLGTLSAVVSFDFSSIDLSSITYDQLVQSVPPEYRTNELLAAAETILSGDFSEVIAAQSYFRHLLNTYGPNVSIYDAIQMDTGTAQPEPLPAQFELPNFNFNLDPALQFEAETSLRKIGEVVSPLYDILPDGSWISEATDLANTALGSHGLSREELFDQIGATAYEGVKDAIEDEIKDRVRGLGDIGNAVVEALSVRKILGNFIGNMMDLAEQGMDYVSGKNDIGFRDYEDTANGNIYSFKKDASDFLSDKFGFASESIVDSLSNFGFGTREVNSFEAVVFKDKVISGSGKKDTLFGSSRDDHILPGRGQDVVMANGGNDRIEIGARFEGDWIYGGAGTDTVSFGMVRDAAQIIWDGNVTQVSFGSRFVLLKDVERLAFADITLARDIDGKPGELYRLYQAAFGRQPDIAGLSSNLETYESGTFSLRDMANFFVNAPEFAQLYGSGASDDTFVAALYKNVLGRDPDAGGRAYYTDWLARSPDQRAEVLTAFSQSPENIDRVALAIGGAIALEADRDDRRIDLPDFTGWMTPALGYSVPIERIAVSGGAGVDTAVTSYGSYSVQVGSGEEGQTSLVTPQGIYDLRTVERIEFSDLTLALDVDGAPGELYRLYQAAFGRKPDVQGLTFNLNNYEEHGFSLVEMASFFINAPEFQQLYGANTSDGVFINALYHNVLGRAADASGLSFYQDWLNRDPGARAQILAAFSESPENVDLVAPSIANGIVLDTDFLSL